MPYHHVIDKAKSKHPNHSSSNQQFLLVGNLTMEYFASQETIVLTCVPPKDEQLVKAEDRLTKKYDTTYII